MDLFEYLRASKTAYHAVSETAKLLEKAGFKELYENERWVVERGKAYFVRRNSSSLFAFKIPDRFCGAVIMATHSDSPTYKLKSKPFIKKDNGYISLNIAGYGGMIHSTFLDRKLGLAGRIFVREAGRVIEKLVDLPDVSISIPNSAIHLNPEINRGYEYKISKDMLPILCESPDDGEDMSLERLFGESDVIGHDIFLYVKDEPGYFGVNKEFVGSPRLDNLECSYVVAKAIAESVPNDYISMFAMLDNEEVGSATRQGADSTFIVDCMHRIYENLGMGIEEQKIFEAKSFLVSCDNAHGLHPNYVEKSDTINRPYLNKGVVIKHSANGKYTTDGFSAAVIKDICEKEGIRYQVFENHSDVAGGSTLGNISVRHFSIPAVDIGLAQWAMHSAFETAGARDIQEMDRLLKAVIEMQE